MQLRQLLGTLALEAASQEVGEEVMVTVPNPLVVQGDDQQVIPLKPLKHPLSVVSSGYRVAQGAAETVQDRGLQQEHLHRFALSLQDLFGQEVEDVAVAAGEGPDEVRDVLAFPHRERSQLQGRDPT